MRSLAFWKMIIDLLQNIFGLAIDMLNSFVFDLIKFDFTSDTNLIATQFPFMPKVATIAQAVAVVLLICITAYNLFRGTMGDLVETDKPARLLVRSAIFMALIYMLPYLIIYVVLEPLKVVWDTLASESSGMQYTMTSWLKYFLEYAQQPYTAADIVLTSSLMTLILSVSIGIAYFKLVLQAIERWVTLYVLFLLSPLAAATGASATTNKIFSSYCRMFITAVFLLLLDGIFLVIFASGLSYKIQNAGAMRDTFNLGILDPKNAEWIWSLMALAILRTGLRLESYISSLGISVAQCGSGLMTEIGGTVGAMLMGGRMISGMARGSALGQHSKNAMAKHSSENRSATSAVYDTKELREASTERVSGMMPSMAKQGVIADNAVLVGQARQRSDGTLSFTTYADGEGDMVHTMYADEKAALEANPDGKLNIYNDENGKQYFVSNVKEGGLFANSYETIERQFGSDFINEQIPDMNGKVSGVTTNIGGAITLHASEGYTQNLYPLGTYRQLDNAPPMKTVTAANGQKYAVDPVRRVDLTAYTKASNDYLRNPSNSEYRAGYAEGRDRLEKQLGKAKGSIADYCTVRNGEGAALEIRNKDGSYQTLATEHEYKGKIAADTAIPYGKLYDGRANAANFTPTAIKPIERVGSTRAEKVLMRERMADAGKRALGIMSKRR